MADYMALACGEGRLNELQSECPNAATVRFQRPLMSIQRLHAPWGHLALGLTLKTQTMSLISSENRLAGISCGRLNSVSLVFLASDAVELARTLTGLVK